MSISIHLNEFWRGYLYATAYFIVVNVGWAGVRHWRKP